MVTRMSVVVYVYTSLQDPVKIVPDTSTFIGGLFNSSDTLITWYDTEKTWAHYSMETTQETLQYRKYYEITLQRLLSTRNMCGSASATISNHIKGCPFSHPYVLLHGHQVQLNICTYLAYI